MTRVFLLSPAFSGGKRGELLLNPSARFDLAVRLRAAGASLGEIYSFLSGLYFRGKLAYGRAFAAPPRGMKREQAVLVITPGAGLVPPDATLTLPAMRAFAEIDVDPGEPRFCVPLEESTDALARALGRRGEAVLLGSIATDKYVGTLTHILGKRLVFPPDFVGRGDMSRGGLLLRCVRARQELAYVPVDGAVRHGKRPPRLTPLRPRAGRDDDAAASEPRSREPRA